jgi:cardiolipin synthase
VDWSSVQPFLPAAGVTLVALEWLLRLGLVTRILLRRTPASDAVAWITFIALVPVLGCVIYLLMGETPLGRRRRRAHDKLEREAETRGREALACFGAATAWPIDALSSSMIRLGSAVGGLPAVGGNALELFDDATTVLDRLRADIDAAQKHVHLLYYIWGDSPGARAVVDAVERAARRGVRCRLLADAVGSSAWLKSAAPVRLRAAGAQVEACLPVNPFRRSLHRIDLRNHRKIAVIDGTIAYCGSQNMIDDRVRVKRIPPRYRTWIDTSVRLRGPAVVALQAAFLGDWLSDSREAIGDFAAYLSVPESPGSTLVQVLPRGPGDRPEAVHQTFLGLLHNADREVVLTTPYFVPDESTRAALVNAAKRGVKVTIIKPDILDAPVVAAAGRAYYDELLSVGVRIAQHRGGLLHAKNAVIDGRLAMIGSANFDRRSFDLNFEITLLVFGEDFARGVLALQDKYLADSIIVDPANWRRRSRWKRFRDNAASLLSPLL